MTDLTALKDQATAAQAETVRRMSGVAAELASNGAPVLPSKPPAVFSARLHLKIQDARQAAASAGQRLRCEHLDLGRPEVAWLIGSTGEVLCPDCARQTAAGAAPECDLCDRPAASWGVYALPVVAEKLVAGRAVVLSALVHWQACESCLVGDLPPGDAA